MSAFGAKRTSPECLPGVKASKIGVALPLGVLKTPRFRPLYPPLPLIAPVT
jgi:hypothetical protein